MNKERVFLIFLMISTEQPGTNYCNLNGRLVSQSVERDEAAVSSKHQPTVLKGPKTKVLLMVIRDWL